MNNSLVGKKCSSSFCWDILQNMEYGTKSFILEFSNLYLNNWKVNMLWDKLNYYHYCFGLFFLYKHTQFNEATE